MIFITVTQEDVKQAAISGDFPIAKAIRRRIGGLVNCAYTYCGVALADDYKEFTYSENLKETLDFYRGEYESRIQFPPGRYGLFEN